MRKYRQITALAMATCGKGNDGQTATLVMATHDKGNDRQITRALGNRDIGQVDGLRRESNNGQVVVLAMATRSEGNDGQVNSERNGHARQS